MLKKMILAGALSFGLSAQAFEVSACGWLDSVSFLAAPVKTYYNGDVRVALIDTDGEPVCCSVHVLVYVPTSDGLGRDCYAVSQGDGLGYVDILFNEITSAYDSHSGLDLTIPWVTYDGDRGEGTIRVDLRRSQKVRVVR